MLDLFIIKSHNQTVFEVFLNFIARNLSEKHKATYKKDFYNNLYFTHTPFIRILYVVIFVIFIGDSIAAVLNGSRTWWLPPILFLALLIIHLSVTINGLHFKHHTCGRMRCYPQKALRGK